MEYRTFPLVAGVDSDGNVFFRVAFEGEVLSFTEMHDRFNLMLISVVPINADESNWKGVGIFSRQTES